MLNHPTPVPSPTPWEALHIQLDTLTTTITTLTAEQAVVDAALDDTDLDPGTDRADALRDRARQLTAAIAEHERLAARLAHQIDTARTAANRIVAQASQAKRIITAITSPAGLMHPDLRRLAVRDLPQRVAIARRRLAAVGETVPPITITL